MHKKRGELSVLRALACMALLAGSAAVVPREGWAQQPPVAMIPGKTGDNSGALEGILPQAPKQAAEPAATAVPVAPAAAGPVSSSASAGINLPAPPPANAFSSDATQLAAQAEQAALQAQAEAEAEKNRRELEHNEKSFKRASGGLLPLSPDQIRDFMRRMENTDSAAVAPSQGPPKVQTRITTLSLDPGTDPPQIELASGFVTTITIVDATGEPWPILDVGVGGSFEVSPTQAGSHIVRIMPLNRVGVGNLSVVLKDLTTPVIFRLASGGPSVDLRYDARIPKYGPGAKPPLINRPRLEAGNETIMLLLANAPPNTAKRIKISGLDSRTMAWSISDHMFVRTPLTLLSPAWDASVSSTDGMTVYEIQDAPVLLMSDNGALVRARLSRDDDHDKQ